MHVFSGRKSSAGPSVRDAAEMLGKTQVTARKTKGPLQEKAYTHWTSALSSPARLLSCRTSPMSWRSREGPWSGKQGGRRRGAHWAHEGKCDRGRQTPERPYRQRRQHEWKQKSGTAKAGENKITCTAGGCKKDSEYKKGPGMSLVSRPSPLCLRQQRRRGDPGPREHLLHSAPPGLHAPVGFREEGVLRPHGHRYKSAQSSGKDSGLERNRGRWPEMTPHARRQAFGHAPPLLAPSSYPHPHTQPLRGDNLPWSLKTNS